jgi:hypothetical protein
VILHILLAHSVAYAKQSRALRILTLKTHLQTSLGLGRRECDESVHKNAKGLGLHRESIKVSDRIPNGGHVMGTVWRIVYDDRLNQDELIDSMNMERSTTSDRGMICHELR